MSKLGTPENPIIDSGLSREEALLPNPELFLPPEIFERQILLPVIYLSFDEKYHQGQIVVDKELKTDVKDFFELALKENFPINKIIPIADKKFNFEDSVSMKNNNTSGFNPRKAAGEDRISNHASGRAIDINPLQNPFIKNDLVEPTGAVYKIEERGTFSAEHPLVFFLKSRGWNWGGDYETLKDYHHFEKPAKKSNSAI